VTEILRESNKDRLLSSSICGILFMDRLASGRKLLTPSQAWRCDPGIESIVVVRQCKRSEEFPTATWLD
jgi:hypothetical protein